MILVKIITLFLCMATHYSVSANPFKKRPERQSSAELAQHILKCACQELARSQNALKKQLETNPTDPTISILQDAVRKAEDALRQASREAKTEADFQAESTRIPPVNNDASAAAQPESKSHSQAPQEPFYAKTPACVGSPKKRHIYERMPSTEEMLSICDAIEQPAIATAPPPIPPRPDRTRTATVRDLRRFFENNS